MATSTAPVQSTPWPPVSLQLWAGLHTAILALALVVLGFAVFLAAHGVSLAVVLAICTIVP